MKMIRLLRRPWLATTLCGIITSAAGWLFAGPWTPPTLPSAIYSHDEIPFFPEGSQIEPSKSQLRALEEYKKTMKSAGKVARSVLND